MSDSKEQDLREKIINAIKEKRSEDADKAEEIADFIVSQPYIHEGTYEVFMKNAGLL